MCAIFSASKISKFEILYEANLPRGNFASGIVCLYDGNNQQTIKKEGTLDFNSIELDDRCEYFLGHVQAPTSANRKWSYDTSHPFESVSWSVMHNGVLTNYKDLQKQHPEWDPNIVDTSVIPNLLQYYTEEKGGDYIGHEIVKRVLTKLEGTFAVAIVDTDCNDVYIARQGSVLHYNDKGDVSTLGGEGFKLVPEGVILMLKDYKHWTMVNTFETNSPFLFL